LLGSSDARGATYDFLSVSGNGIAGNAATSQFTSSNGNGFIDVTHSFPGGAWGPNDNDNSLIIPSAFTTIFPGTGNVDGHLVQTLYNSTSVTTFDLSNYNLSASTVFGMWNTTDEVVSPPGGAPVYRIELLVSNIAGPPNTFGNVGTQDNTGAAGVLGRHQMVLTASTGAISAGGPINGGAGVHTNALFWDQIPAGTTEIRVYGDLPPLLGNVAGDGVGYYFAEVVPEPTTLALLICGGLGLMAPRRRNCLQHQRGPAS
jgi:hypothetical protein